MSRYFLTNRHSCVDFKTEETLEHVLDEQCYTNTATVSVPTKSL